MLRVKLLWSGTETKRQGLWVGGSPWRGRCFFSYVDYFTNFIV